MILVVVVLTLAIWWPYDFSFAALNNLHTRLVGLGRDHPLEVRELVPNFLVFLPLGLAVVAAAKRSALVAGLAGLVVSLTLEAGQFLLPGRMVSITDVVMNTAGAAVGAIAATAVPKLLRQAACTRVRPDLVAIGTLVLAVGAYVWLQEKTSSLDAWATDYPLLIGNEATDSRLWCGKILYFNLMAGDRIWTRDSFQFHTLGLDAPGQCTWFTTAEPVWDVTSTAQASGYFRLELEVQPMTIRQFGPARIISTSSDLDHRNITVGQAGPDLIVRVRRFLGGTNGQRPYYKIPDVFQAERPVRIIVEIRPDGTRVTAANRTLIHRHDIATQWWILLLSNYEWRPLSWERLAALPFWLLISVVSILVNAVDIRQKRHATAYHAVVAVAAAILLRISGIAPTWDSVVWLPLAYVLWVEIGRILVGPTRPVRDTAPN